MKTKLYSNTGEEKGTIELPKLFETKPREDIVQKFFEADKFIQPYAAKHRAGLRQSASGTILHKRHDWKGHYGRGVSRMPKKTMWRRGTQFMWVGANVPATRGGRKAHPPKGIGKEKKINKKEIKMAFNSGFAATVSPHYLTKRYSSLNKVENPTFVIEALPKKTKELIKLLKHVLHKNLYELALKKKSVRAGKGKLRGRKYKSNAGALVVISANEKAKFSGLDIKPVSEVTIADLYPLGRLTIYTKSALNELEGK